MNLDALQERQSSDKEDVGGSKAVSAGTTTAKAAGEATEVTGAAMQGTGKALDAAGKAKTVNRVYGRSNSLKPRVGKVGSLKPGQRLRNHLPLPGGRHFNTKSLPPGLGRRLGKRKQKKANVAGDFVYRRAVQASMWWVCTVIWFWQIVMFALLLFLFMIWATISKYEIIQTAASWGGSIFDWVTGYEGSADAITSFSITFVLMPWFLSAFVCLAVLALIAMVLTAIGKVTGSSPLTGNSNNAYILLSIIGYSILVFLPLPWAMPWLWHTYLHPKG